MRFSRCGQQTGGRRLAAFAARWLVNGSVPTWGRRARAWARRSVAGIGLPVSPDRRERRESSSASPPAFACPGPEGGAAGRGVSGVFRCPGLPIGRRADGGVASAALPGNATGRRDPGRLRARSLAAHGLAAVLLAAFAALLALPPQAQAQTALPWDGQTLKDATKKVGARRIVNSGDVVWYSLPNLNENGVYQFSYFQYAQDRVSRPKLQVYRPNGEPVVHHGHEIAATGDYPNLLFMPDAAGTYYMKVSSLDDDTGKFWIHYADYSLSPSVAGDRNGADCSGLLDTRCGMPAPGHDIDGKTGVERTRDRYDFALRKGGEARVCVTFSSDAVGGYHTTYMVSSPTGKWSTLFSKEAGTFCTEGFTPNHTGIYEVVVGSMVSATHLSRPSGNLNRNYEVRYELAPFVANATGTDPVTPTEPLTATLEDFPTNHDGSSAFTFRIAFSADVEITPEDMRDHALTVTDGTVTNATQVDGRSDLWELTVEPAGTAAVTILVPLNRACTETGALCTADGLALSTAPGHSVPGPTPAPQGQQAQAPAHGGFRGGAGGA